MHLRSVFCLTGLAGVLLVGSACNKAIGNTLASSSDHFVIPDVMASGDVGVGCASGEGTGVMVRSYRPFSPKARKGSIIPQLSAGMCVEEEVWEARLSGSRAMQSGDVAAAKDALTVERRAHYDAARRYLVAWELLASEYGVPEPDGECPKLKTFEDQRAYLLGLSSGVLAVLHDMAAQGQADVPWSIPAAVVRGASCLDDDAWWGAPRAMQASIYALQPEAPGALDPWDTFAASVAKGEAAGVRLASAFHVQTAATVGREDLMRQGIKAFAASEDGFEVNPAFRTLDRFATLNILHESDRIWTRLEGHRTPWGELGTFPDDAEPEAPALDDDLFDDLLTE